MNTLKPNEKTFGEYYCSAICEAKSCCGKEYCGNYKRFVLGENSELDSIMWQMKLQMELSKCKGDKE